jgi:uncharacterized protein YdcH (DUF465 family)
MCDYEFYEEIKALKANNAREIKALTDTNAKLTQQMEELKIALDVAKVQASNDAETIRVLHELITHYEGQIEAFKFCIGNGAAV